MRSESDVESGSSGGKKRIPSGLNAWSSKKWFLRAHPIAQEKSRSHPKRSFAAIASLHLDQAQTILGIRTTIEIHRFPFLPLAMYAHS